MNGGLNTKKENEYEEIDNAVKGLALVDMIQSAQQEDGYLNIHSTVVEPGKRFTNLRDLHELYGPHFPLLWSQNHWSI